MSTEAPSLKSRIAQLITYRDHGNVTAAAKRMGVSQATLDRIVRGVVQNPRAAVLDRIASTNGVTIEWLLTGNGVPPFVHIARGHEALEYAVSLWAPTVYALRLPTPLDDLLLCLPFALDEFCSVLGLFGDDAHPIPAEEAVPLAELRARNVMHFYDVLQQAITKFGGEQVRAAILANGPRLMLRFSSVGDVLLEQEVLTDEELTKGATLAPSTWPLFLGPNPNAQKAAVREAINAFSEALAQGQHVAGGTTQTDARVAMDAYRPKQGTQPPQKPRRR